MDMRSTEPITNDPDGIDMLAILTLDDFIASIKQKLIYNKTTSRTSVANIPFSVFDIAGNPGAGTIAVGNTANGIVPTDAIAGYPIINAFGGGAKGYLAKVEASNTIICDLAIYDTIFSAGAYVFNADVTLATQPSYSGRVPGGTEYTGLELWIEAATAFTGNQTVQINYLDQDGNAGDTGAIATGIAPILGRMLQLPLAAGDNGIQRIDRVRSSVSTVGTFNVHVLRPLWEGRIAVANQAIVDDMLKTGLPEVFADSALRVIVQPDSTATQLPRLRMTIANK
jgi:hypothetical protein